MNQAMKKKIAEIREALEKATQGPWEYEMWEGCADVYPTTGRHVPICQLWTKTEEPMENAENNAHLIANAPEWLRFLLSELERLEREYAEERAAHNAHVTELCEKEKECRKLRAERDDLSFLEKEAYGAFKYWFGAWEEVKKENEQLHSQLQSAQAEVERLREELERIKCSNCGNEGIYETGIEKDGLRETKFCGQCVYGERAKMMHELRSALFESEEESRKLREERDIYKREIDCYQALAADFDVLKEKYKSAQQEIERLKEHVSRAWKSCWKVAEEDTKREQKLIEAICAIKPFLDEDFPEGPDGPNCAAEAYREAYRKVCDIIREIGVTTE